MRADRGIGFETPLLLQEPRMGLRDVERGRAAPIGIQRAHQRQTATGLVVNQKVNLPRATRRLIRAMQHRERQGRLDEAGRRRLRGLLDFQRMVEKQR